MKNGNKHSILFSIACAWLSAAIALGQFESATLTGVVSGNANNGITASGSGAGSAVLTIENTTVSSNNYGLVAGGTGAGMLVSQSSIVLNNTGLFTVNVSP